MTARRQQHLAGMPGKWRCVPDGSLLHVGDFCARAQAFWTTPDNQRYGPGSRSRWFRPYDNTAKYYAEWKVSV